MQKSNYEIDVLVNGRPVNEYFHNGKNYIEGRKGTEFSLRLRNNFISKKLFVVSIDGLSVIDGKDASYDSSGYIVPAKSSVTIDGWRVSDKEVAKFYFSKEKDSYRVKSGKGKNLGVIGVAVFDEKNKYIFPTMNWCSVSPSTTIRSFDTGEITTPSGTARLSGYSYDSALDSASLTYCCSSYQSESKQELGTGWGDSKKSEVTNVEFEREEKPETVFEIFYNTREQLEKIGVQFKKPVYITPQAFPGQYCKPPKDRN